MHSSGTVQLQDGCAIHIINIKL